MRNFIAVALLCAAAITASCSAEPTPPPPPAPNLVEFDPPGPKDSDLALRAAVFLGSCFSQGSDNSSPQSIIDNMYYAFQTDWPYTTAMEYTTRCFADQAEGCKSVEDCFAAHSVLVWGECATTCLPGNIAQVCGGLGIPDRAIILDCNRLGMQCTSRGCSPYPIPEACDPTTFELCKDGVANNCPSNYPYLARGVDCSALGLQCDAMPFSTTDPWAYCKGTGAACEPYTEELSRIVYRAADISCLGTEAHACVNYAEHVYDCGSLGKGFSCQGTGKTAFCGLGNECDPGSTFETSCDGDQIVVCNAGRVDRVDCKALGFEGCDPVVGLCFPNPASKR